MTTTTGPIITDTPPVPARLDLDSVCSTELRAEVDRLRGEGTELLAATQRWIERTRRAIAAVDRDVLAAMAHDEGGDGARMVIEHMIGTPRLLELAKEITKTVEAADRCL